MTQKQIKARQRPGSCFTECAVLNHGASNTDKRNNQMFWVLFSTCLVIIIAHYLKLWWTKWRKLPPGPFGLPLVGYMHRVTPGRRWETYVDLEKKFGPIFSISTFDITEVILNDWEDVNYLYNRSDTAERPEHIFSFIAAGGKNAGLLSSNGRVWFENRRFAIRSLRDFGFGKSSLNDVIMTEIRTILVSMSQDVGKPVDLGPQLNLAVLNVMWRMTANEAFDQNDPTLNEFFRSINVPDTVSSSPVLSRLATVRPRLMFWKIKSAIARFHPETNIFARTIQEHKESRDPYFNRDYIDAYLQEAEKRRDPQVMNEEQLYFCIHNLFLAGSETTSTTLRWAILMLTANPEIQQKTQQEIDKFVEGTNRLICLDDRNHLHYVEAVIMEVLRLGNVVPAVPHVCTVDIPYKGYVLLKGTWIEASQAGIHMNSKYWPNPEKFDPERFLDEDGKAKTGKIPGFLPFGLGKRQCLGESLARMELFLLVAYFLYHFTFKPVPGEKLPSINDTIRTSPVLKPPPYHVIMELRHPI